MAAGSLGEWSHVGNSTHTSNLAPPNSGQGLALGLALLFWREGRERVHWRGHMQSMECPTERTGFLSWTNSPRLPAAFRPLQHLQRSRMRSPALSPFLALSPLPVHQNAAWTILRRHLAVSDNTYYVTYRPSTSHPYHPPPIPRFGSHLGT